MSPNPNNNSNMSNVNMNMNMSMSAMSADGSSVCRWVEDQLRAQGLRIMAVPASRLGDLQAQVAKQMSGGPEAVSSLFGQSLLPDYVHWVLEHEGPYSSIYVVTPLRPTPLLRGLLVFNDLCLVKPYTHTYIHIDNRMVYDIYD